MKKKTRKPNLERLYMMHSLKESTKIARQALAESVSYGSVLPARERKMLERITAELGTINARVHMLISAEHDELNDGGHTSIPRAAR